MRATIIHAPRDIRIEERPDPVLRRPDDAVVRVVAACVCGSDLWPYRGVRPVEKPHPIGHEFVGVVEAVGDEVSTLAVGDFVVAPWAVSCGECPQCLNGVHVACDHRASWGGTDEYGFPVDAGQGERVRVPMADGTLVPVPGVTDPEEGLLKSLLTLSDVMGTGHHAALAARVGPARTVVVVGDGAVGLCGVLAARRLGAKRIIAMSRHEDRAAIARRFGATEVVAERGKAAAEKVRELLGGVLDDSV
ncbi:MAG: alcohol dehydrogenase catalytic domain-containing protein, partial [Sinomonas sp.]|nr:alcohol dehydrogenase catalytic domain-containing protein [Sinomonas sp.]